jgi:hypothetical protein
VTLGPYIGKSEAQLRAGWHTVADFIDAATRADSERSRDQGRPTATSRSSKPRTDRQSASEPRRRPSDRPLGGPISERV